MAKLTIDGKEIEVPDGTRLFDACTEARGGEQLPHFCYHPDLSIAGVCRLCQVEVEGMPKLTIACNTIVRDGMVVHTRSEKVNKASKQILEMHLINHPVDCPICDQAGECGLQDQYMEYGLYDSQVEVPQKVNKRKAKVIGPQVILDQERCVLCSRCVRFCEEYSKTGELGIFNRGDRAEIDVPEGVELDNNYSINTVDICPVGALTSRDFRFQKRVWMLKAAESVCPGCATGCNVRIDYEADRIYRLKPRYNPDVNGRFMCDKGRMTYKDVHASTRLDQPRAGGEATDWSGALGRFDGGFKLGLVIGSAHQTLEEMWLLGRLAAAAGGAQVSGGLAGSGMGEGDDILLSADRTPNRAGLAIVGLPEHGADELAGKIQTAGAVLILGGDPAADEKVAAALKICGEVIYIGTHENATSALASVVLPGCTWSEKAGVFANKDSRLQAFKPSIKPLGSAREDWRILTEMMAAAGVEDVPVSLPLLRKAINADLFAESDINLNQLPGYGVCTGGESE